MTITTSHLPSGYDEQHQVRSSNPEERPPAPLSLNTAWMPLEGVAQQWARFAGTFLTSAAFTATSAVFTALALETEALQHANHASFRNFNGDDRLGRAADEQAIHALQEASAQWLCALCWLERLADDRRHPLDDEHHAVLRTFFEEATTQLQRLGVLTQQVQAACVLSYQRCGMLSQQEEDAR